MTITFEKEDIEGFHPDPERVLTTVSIDLSTFWFIKNKTACFVKNKHTIEFTLTENGIKKLLHALKEKQEAEEDEFCTLGKNELDDIFYHVNAISFKLFDLIIRFSDIRSLSCKQRSEDPQKVFYVCQFYNNVDGQDFVMLTQKGYERINRILQHKKLIEKKNKFHYMQKEE